MHTVKNIPMPGQSTQSTFLVGKNIYEKFMVRRFIKGKRLSIYLGRLLEDKQLEYKLSLLKPVKWKTEYQEAGQNLVPLYFYPSESDWARLSVISHSTGFSRCYIFVYLMLLDLGVLKLPNDRTKRIKISEIKKSQIFCRVYLDERKNLLTRVLHT